MASAARVFALLIVASCLVATFEGRNLQHSDVECTEPPTGLWYIEHFIQITPGNFINRFFSDLRLEKSFDNVFSGTTNTTDRDGGFSGNLFLIGIFDMDTCTMTGSLTSFDFGISDNFKWKYNGNTLDGVYVVTINGTVPVPVYNRHEAVFRG